MAISKAMAFQMVEHVKRYSLTGHVLQLGKQDVWLDNDDLEELANQCSLQLKNRGSSALVRSQFMRNRLVITDETFFKSIGYSRVSSLDMNNYEGATFAHDLNVLPTPPDLVDKFDVIYDIGTVEHVFHLPNALTNIHNMLKVGGHVVHSSPCSNAFEHGFYMFSPCFFFDYYRANGYEILDSVLVRYRVNSRKELTTCEVMDCWPESRGLTALSYIGSLDAKFYAINIVVRKSASSTAGVVPQQGYYKTVWSKTRREGREDNGLAIGTTLSMKWRLFNLVNNMPVLGIVARSFYTHWTRWKNVRWRKLTNRQGQWV